jgi:hypothetical protein
MPRVTEILDYLTEPELMRWIENNSKAKRKAIQDEALRVGSACDLLVQQDIKDGGYLVPEGDTPIENCMRAWELFKTEHPEFIDSVKDMQFELRDGELIGHPDFLCKFRETWGIVDLKCASGIRPRYWTQTAIYSEMVRQHVDPLYLMNHEIDMPRFIGVLRLDKVTATYEYIEITDEIYIRYEIDVFRAYQLAFSHNVNNREMIRQQLEKEILNVS